MKKWKKLKKRMKREQKWIKRFLRIHHIRCPKVIPWNEIKIDARKHPITKLKDIKTVVLVYNPFDPESALNEENAQADPIRARESYISKLAQLADISEEELEAMKEKAKQVETEALIRRFGKTGESMHAYELPVQSDRDVFEEVYASILALKTTKEIPAVPTYDELIKVPEQAKTWMASVEPIRLSRIRNGHIIMDPAKLVANLTASLGHDASESPMFDSVQAMVEMSFYTKVHDTMQRSLNPDLAPRTEAIEVDVDET